MTEYWKSQARKYCDFCKCWLADNKVSISFHENGKRHKENVSKHISTLSKKSAKDHKAKEKMDDEIRKMEAAAMAAYLKDVENNADITSQCINEKLGTGPAPGAPPAAPAPPAEPAPPPAPTPPRRPVWHEVACDTGNYYWNTKSNETTWVAPDEYVTLEQQEEEKLKDKEKEKKKEKQKKQKQKESFKEVKAHLAREQMRALAPPPAAAAAAAVVAGPAPRPAKPYGTWQAVDNQAEEQVDLQLPKVEVFAPPVVMEPERIQFSERKVTSLGDGPVEFKRRKLNNRNMRQKVHDE